VSREDENDSSFNAISLLRTPAAGSRTHAIKENAYTKDNGEQLYVVKRLNYYGQKYLKLIHSMANSFITTKRQDFIKAVNKKNYAKNYGKLESKPKGRRIIKIERYRFRALEICTELNCLAIRLSIEKNYCHHKEKIKNLNGF